MIGKTPEERSALIGAASAIVVAIISGITAYFITHTGEDENLTPIVIEKPFIVKEKEIIREFYGDNNTPKQEESRFEEKQPKNEDGKQEVDVEDQNDATHNMEQNIAEPFSFSDDWLNKNVGIYYALGNQRTKNKAGMLSGYMQSVGVNSSYYSIGRFYSKPDVPKKTFIYGVDLNKITKVEFISLFKETFKFQGDIELKELDNGQSIVLDGRKWAITMNKEIYVVVGE